MSFPFLENGLSHTLAKMTFRHFPFECKQTHKTNVHFTLVMPCFNMATNDSRRTQALFRPNSCNSVMQQQISGLDLTEASELNRGWYWSLEDIGLLH